MKMYQELKKLYLEKNHSNDRSETRELGGVKYFLDFNMDGAPVMEEPKTIGIFFDLMKEIDELLNTIDLRKYEDVQRWNKRHDEIFAIIREKVNPQEVYFYELRNYECQYSRDDRDAIKATLPYFSPETVEIKRMYQH